MMTMHAPPTDASPRRQLHTMKIINGLAFILVTTISVLSVFLIGPAAFGLPIIGVIAVLCAAGSQNRAEESLVVITRDFRKATL